MYFFAERGSICLNRTRSRLEDEESKARMRHVNAEKLMEYMDGQLTDEAKAMIDGHLSHCSGVPSRLKQELSNS